MIKSMTGYGVETASNEYIELNVEVKSLNSKYLDAAVRLSRNISDKEIEVRNLITDRLVRGKVTVNIEVKKKQEESSTSYNKEQFQYHYEQLKALADSVGDHSPDIFRLTIQSPDVITTPSTEDSPDSYWEEIKKNIITAIDKCDQYRIDEGKGLKSKLEAYIAKISDQLKEVIAIAPERVNKVKDRITSNLRSVVDEDKIDQNRYEQELIYYIEKLDISEEQVRLSNHLEYFIEVINLPKSNGKKLGFIAQEIGREINTIGSKANDADIQKKVVIMKEELEKIKEQVLNVL